MSEFDAIPAELTERPQWICWAAKTRNGKPTKIPKQPDGSTANAKASDMATWGTFEQAVREAQKRDGWGIGFVFATADPFVGIDLDTCLTERGTPAEWLTEIGLGPFNGETYIEASPSGTGLHIIAEGERPEWWTNVETDTEDAHEGVEVYDSGRFFTFTGDAIDTSVSHVSSDIDTEAWFKTAYSNFRDTNPWETSDARPATGSGASGDGDIDLTVSDVVSGGGYPAGERFGHPVHGSDTGSNFMVDDDGETWRCWRHQCTGNALHLAGMQEGIIRCGEWSSGGLSSDTWSEIFDAARERGLDVGEKTSSYTSAAEEAAKTDGGAAADDSGPDSDTTPTRSIRDRVRYEVLHPVDPPEEWEGEEIGPKVAVQRFTDILVDFYDYIRPREDVRGWRDTLYVYEASEGIYEPHGETQIQEESERLLGSWVNNQQINEIIGKITRRSFKRPGELETTPEMLCVDNGILNVHTGEIVPHSPDEYHRTKIEIRYDPSAECPRIDEFLNEIVDSSDVDTLYRLIAHCIYGEYAAEKAAMLVGDGRNGKSVFLSLVEEFLGEYNVSHRALQEFSENDFAANDLEGKLANVHPDMGDEMVRDLGTFKKLTGRDTMTADVKYEKPITFENRATLLFAANRMPVMDEDTTALWRRWIYLNFPHTFDDDDPSAKDEIPKRQLMNQLTEESELEGLLARCVEEISEWWNGRKWFPDTMGREKVREKMKRASEPVYDFAASCIRVTDDNDDFIPKEQVRKAYREYARVEGLPTKSDNALGEKLLNLRDYPMESARRRIDGQRVRAYTGVELTSRGRQILGIDESDEDESLDDSGGSVRDIVEVVRKLDDGEGVTRAMILGRATTRMGMSTAEKMIDKAKTTGEITSMDGEHFYVTD